MPPSANVAQAVVPKLRQLHADGFCIVIFTNQARRGVVVRPSYYGTAGRRGCVSHAVPAGASLTHWAQWSDRVGSRARTLASARTA